MIKEVRFLRAGSCRIDRSALKVDEEPGQFVLAPIWAYLIRTGDALFLVDTGMPDGCIDNEQYFEGTEDGAAIFPLMKKEDEILAILGRQGVRAADLDGVISTHWHFDHAGSNQKFRERPVLVHPAEIQAAKEGDYQEECCDLTLDYREIGDGYEPSAGITLLHTPGHTPGHTSVLLRMPDGPPLLLTIDATYTMKNWTTGVPGAMKDEATGIRSAQRLHTIAGDEKARIFCGHDPDQAQDPAWLAFQA